MSFPKQEPPASIIELTDRIIHYGKFAEGCEYLKNLMQSNNSTTVIIRGNVGAGKKTLVKTVMNDLKNVRVIYVNPYYCTDDYSTLKGIAEQLDIKVKPSLQELMEDIEVKSTKSKHKIVFVLIDFEEFCRQKQSLLYSLTTLTQHGENINLIGLTVNLDCTEKLEKRVRSRLNALFYELSLPYTNEIEFVEFATHLLGKYNSTGHLTEQLKYNYLRGDRSLRQLKRYLMSVCYWDINNKLTILPEPEAGCKNEVDSLRDRLRWLTKNQLELLKLAIFYCFEKNRLDFSANDLCSTAMKHNYPAFSCKLVDIALLAKMSFIKTNKPNQIMDQYSVFTINVTPTSFKNVIKNNNEFHFIKTDQFWKRLR